FFFSTRRRHTRLSRDWSSDVCSSDLAGLHLTNTSKRPADHMATELEFMMYLYGSKGIALKEQNRERLGRIDERIAEFEEQHLLKIGRASCRERVLDSGMSVFCAAEMD